MWLHEEQNHDPKSKAAWDRWSVSRAIFSRPKNDPFWYVRKWAGIAVGTPDWDIWLKRRCVESGRQESLNSTGVKTGRIVKGIKWSDGNTSSKKVTQGNMRTYYQGMEPVASWKASASACCVTMLGSLLIRVHLIIAATWWSQDKIMYLTAI